MRRATPRLSHLAQNSPSVPIEQRSVEADATRKGFGSSAPPTCVFSPARAK